MRVKQPKPRHDTTSVTIMDKDAHARASRSCCNRALQQTLVLLLYMRLGVCQYGTRELAVDIANRRRIRQHLKTDQQQQQ